MDLRSDAERTAHPTILAVHEIAEVWARSYRTSSADITRILQDPGATPAGARAAMQVTYRALLDEQADSYATLLDRLSKDGPPLLFHCALGKDRTGVGAALLLDLVGVPRDVIKADYVLTNDRESGALAEADRAMRAASITIVNLPAWAEVVRADPSYLDAMFDAVQTQWGSTQGYAQQRLKISDDQIRAIQARLTIPG